MHVPAFFNCQIFVNEEPGLRVESSGTFRELTNSMRSQPRFGVGVNDGVTVAVGVWVGRGVRVGEAVHVGRGVFVGVRVQVGMGVRVAVGVTESAAIKACRCAVRTAEVEAAERSMVGVEEGVGTVGDRVCGAAGGETTVNTAVAGDGGV